MAPDTGAALPPASATALSRARYVAGGLAVFFAAVLVYTIQVHGSPFRCVPRRRVSGAPRHATGAQNAAAAVVSPPLPSPPPARPPSPAAPSCSRRG